MPRIHCLHLDQLLVCISIADTWLRHLIQSRQRHNTSSSVQGLPACPGNFGTDYLERQDGTWQCSSGQRLRPETVHKCMKECWQLLLWPDSKSIRMKHLTWEERHCVRASAGYDGNASSIAAPLFRNCSLQAVSNSLLLIFALLIGKQHAVDFLAGRPQG